MLLESVLIILHTFIVVFIHYASYKTKQYERKKNCTTNDNNKIAYHPNNAQDTVQKSFHSNNLIFQIKQVYMIVDTVKENSFQQNINVNLFFCLFQ